jgi:hypothetical protein
MIYIKYIVLGGVFLLFSCTPESTSSVNSDIVCLEIYQPVCVDGKTYPNACYAQRDGYDNSSLTVGECSN